MNKTLKWWGLGQTFYWLFCSSVTLTKRGWREHNRHEAKKDICSYIQVWSLVCVTPGGHMYPPSEVQFSQTPIMIVSWNEMQCSWDTELQHWQNGIRPTWPLSLQCIIHCSAWLHFVWGVVALWHADLIILREAWHSLGQQRTCRPDYRPHDWS